MGLFFRKKEPPVRIILPEGSRCVRCGKLIRKEMRFEIIDGKIYCEPCAHAKRDWDFLEFHAMIDD